MYSPFPDPILGRYRMSSSENFDEFMRRLGVGMVKRKMANSVTPVNVVEMEPDGETLFFYRTCHNKWRRATVLHFMQSVLSCLAHSIFTVWTDNQKRSLYLSIKRTVVHCHSLRRAL